MDSLASSASDEENPIPHPQLAPVKVAQIEAAAQMMASDEEIAAHVGITIWQLEEYYADVVERARAKGRIWVRNELWDLAKKGKPATKAKTIRQLAKNVLMIDD